MSGKVKRFMVFGNESYYPSGGWGDFVNSFDTLEEAITCADDFMMKKHPEIVDLETGQDIYVYPKHREKK